MLYIQQTTFHSCSLRDGRSIHARENCAKKNSRTPSGLEKKIRALPKDFPKLFPKRTKHSCKRFRRKIFMDGQFEQKENAA